MSKNFLSRSEIAQKKKNKVNKLKPKPLLKSKPVKLVVPSVTLDDDDDEEVYIPKPINLWFGLPLLLTAVFGVATGTFDFTSANSSYGTFNVLAIASLVFLMFGSKSK